MSTSSGEALSTTAPATSTTSTASTSAITVSPSGQTIMPGATLQLSASGGAPPYSYVITLGGGSIGGSTGLFTAPGTDTTAEITATDSTGTSGTGTVTVSYTPLNLTPTTLTMAPSASFTFQVSGGMTPYTYNIAYGLGTISATGVFTASTSSGTTQIVVEDSNGSEAFATITIGNGSGGTTTPAGCSLISAVAGTSATMTCATGETLSSSGLAGSCGGVSQEGVPSSPSYTVGCNAGVTATGSAYCCLTRTGGSGYQRMISGTGIQQLRLFCGVGESTVSATASCTTTGAVTASYTTSGSGGEEGYLVSCTTATDTASLNVTCSGTVPF